MDIRIHPDLRIVAGRLVHLETNLLRNIIANTVQEIAPELEGALKAEVPVASGAGRDSIRVTATYGRGRGARLTVTGAEHLKYVLEGTKPHPIFPRRAKMLAWTDGTMIHFAKLVHHPGQAPNPFAERAWANVEPSLRRTVRETGLRMWRELTRGLR